MTRRTSSIACSALAPGRCERAGPALEPGAGQRPDAVAEGRATPDAVAIAAGVAARATRRSALARLELLGYVRADAAGRYERTALGAAPPGGHYAQA